MPFSVRSKATSTSVAAPGQFGRFRVAFTASEPNIVAAEADGELRIALEYASNLHEISAWERLFLLPQG